jgi:hypothetical protein
LPIPAIWVSKNIPVIKSAIAPKHNRTEIRTRLNKEDNIPTTRKISVVNKTSYVKESLSLKDILNPKTKEKANAAYIEERTEPFSQDDLSDRWRKFAYSVKLKDLDLYSTLTVNEPVLKEGFLIQLAIFNQAQAVDVNNKKVELLNYLREQLNNTKIDLELVIDKEAETKGVYTIKDKYEKLVEINPAVDVFRKKFDLHF